MSGTTIITTKTIGTFPMVVCDTARRTATAKFNNFLYHYKTTNHKQYQTIKTTTITKIVPTLAAAQANQIYTNTKS